MLRFTIHGGGEVVKLRGEIRSITCRGGQATYLSDLEPTSVEEVAYDILSFVEGSKSRVRTVPGRDGEPLNAEVIASKPLCDNNWPHKVTETVEWYRQWLTR